MRAFIYTNSTSAAEQQNHWDACTGLCHQHGYTVIGSVHDAGTPDHGMRTLRQRIRSNDMDIVVIPDPITLGHRVSTVSSVVAELNEAGIRLVTASKPHITHHELMLVSHFSAAEAALTPLMPQR